MPRKKALPDYYKPINETYLLLEVGQMFKSYKELCLFLKQPVSGGCSKESQMDDFSLYFEYEKEGNKIMIKNVYDIPLFNYSSGAYQSLMQKLVLNKLVEVIEGGERRLIISSGQLMRELHLVNEDYKPFRYDKVGLAKEINCHINEVNNFYISTDSKLTGIIESTFKSLRSGSYAIIDPVTIIKEDHTITVANEWMKEIILRYENIVRIEMGLKDIMDAIFKGVYSEYDSRVLAYMNDELNFYGINVDYYYKAYDIVIGDRLINEFREAKRFKLDNAISTKQALNDVIVSKHKESYISRNGLAWDRLLDDTATYKDGFVAKVGYIDNGHKMIDRTIRRNYI